MACDLNYNLTIIQDNLKGLLGIVQRKFLDLNKVFNLYTIKWVFSVLKRSHNCF